MKTHYINHHPQWVFLHCIKQVAELLEIQRSSAAACCDLNTKLWNWSLFFKRHSEQMKWNWWFIKRLFRSKAYCLLFLTRRLNAAWNPTLFVWRIAILGYVSLLISVLHTYKHTLPLWYLELVSVGSHHSAESGNNGCQNPHCGFRTGSVSFSKFPSEFCKWNVFCNSHTNVWQTMHPVFLRVLIP